MGPHKCAVIILSMVVCMCAFLDGLCPKLMTQIFPSIMDS